MHDRHDRVLSLLREQAAKFIQQEANPDPLITVTNASIAPDYRRVTIFVTTIPEDRQEDALIFLKRNGTEFRHFVKKHTNLKIIPHVDFAIDYGERHRQNIDRISSELQATQNMSETDEEREAGPMSSDKQ